ncbi:hypothetical protein [Catellatospora chokoriensis]|uniref:hypothetical protein n=1 Tax=Catellatospora chokoriensis TaxID=310353 RepID=UPI0017839FAA|nr:hypothetical protein [Catellatospora chokoriensis]
MKPFRVGRTAAALGVVAVFIALAACQSDGGDPTLRLTQVTDVAELGLAGVISVDHAFGLPAGVRVAHYGAHTDGTRVVFGVDPPEGRRAGAAGSYGIVTLSDGRLTFRDASQAGALTDYLAIVAAAGGSHLIRVEAVELPPAQCPDIPVTCYRWRITDELMTAGKPRVIATGDRPTAANEVPQPVTDGSGVAWLTTDHGIAQVWAYQPGGEPRRIGAQVRPGILSATADQVWVGTPVGDAAIYRLPLSGAAAAIRVALPPTAGLATVAGSRVAFRVDESPQSRALCVADLPDPHTCRKVFAAPDIYALYWLGPDALLVSAPDGYSLVRLDGTISRLPLDHLYLVHSDGGRLAFVEQLGDIQVLVVGHLES